MTSSVLLLIVSDLQTKCNISLRQPEKTQNPFFKQSFHILKEKGCQMREMCKSGITGHGVSDHYITFCDRKLYR